MFQSRIVIDDKSNPHVRTLHCRLFKAFVGQGIDENEVVHLQLCTTMPMYTALRLGCLNEREREKERDFLAVDIGKKCKKLEKLYNYGIRGTAHRLI